MIGNYQSATEWLSVDAYIGEVLGAGLPPNYSPNWKLGSIDITEDAAIIKIEDEFGTMKFTDYLSLLNIAGEWKIVKQLYYLHL